MEIPYVFTVENASIECQLHLPTRYLLNLLWRRFLGWNSTANLRINAESINIFVKSGSA